MPEDVYDHIVLNFFIILNCLFCVEIVQVTNGVLERLIKLIGLRIHPYEI